MKKSAGAKPIVFPTPVFIVGSYDAHGQANLMTASWGGLCSSKPPSLAVSIQPKRLTYDNILKSRAFTVSIPSVDQVREADHIGIYSGRKEDKFKTLGLTAVKSELVNAPYVAEFPLIIECRLSQTVEIGVHTQFIGEILDVKADEAVFGPSGVIDPAKVRPLSFAPSNRGYYALGEFIATAFNVGK